MKRDEQDARGGGISWVHNNRSRGELGLTESFRIVDEGVNNGKDITIILMVEGGITIKNKFNSYICNFGHVKNKRFPDGRIQWTM